MFPHLLLCEVKNREQVRNMKGDDHGPFTSVCSSLALLRSKDAGEVEKKKKDGGSRCGGIQMSREMVSCNQVTLNLKIQSCCEVKNMLCHKAHV